jgi:hypothetical protein
MKWDVGAYSRLLQAFALEEEQYPLVFMTAEDSSLYTKDSKSLLQDRPVGQHFPSEPSWVSKPDHWLWLDSLLTIS